MWKVEKLCVETLENSESEASGYCGKLSKVLSVGWMQWNEWLVRVIACNKRKNADQEKNHIDIKAETIWHLKHITRGREGIPSIRRHFKSISLVSNAKANVSRRHHQSRRHYCDPTTQMHENDRISCDPAVEMQKASGSKAYWHSRANWGLEFAPHLLPLILISFCPARVFSTATGRHERRFWGEKLFHVIIIRI